MNNTTGAQRHNKRQDKIWNIYKAQQIGLSIENKDFADALSAREVAENIQGIYPKEHELNKLATNFLHAAESIEEQTQVERDREEYDNYDAQIEPLEDDFLDVLLNYFN